MTVALTEMGEPRKLIRFEEVQANQHTPNQRYETHLLTFYCVELSINGHPHFDIAAVTDTCPGDPQVPSDQN